MPQRSYPANANVMIRDNKSEEWRREMWNRGCRLAFLSPLVVKHFLLSPTAPFIFHYIYRPNHPYLSAVPQIDYDLNFTFSSVPLLSVSRLRFTVDNSIYILAWWGDPPDEQQDPTEERHTLPNVYFYWHFHEVKFGAILFNISVSFSAFCQTWTKKPHLVVGVGVQWRYFTVCCVQRVRGDELGGGWMVEGRWKFIIIPRHRERWCW